jgi:aspartate racemase
MAKHIGIVGCSAEGAALCYRTICSEAPKVIGEHRHPEIPLIVDPKDAPLPTLDSTRLLARAALRKAMAA